MSTYHSWRCIGFVVKPSIPFSRYLRTIIIQKHLVIIDDPSVSTNKVTIVLEVFIAIFVCSN